MEVKKSELMRAGKPRGFADGMAVSGAGGFVFLSGVTGQDYETGATPLGFEAQVHAAWNSIIDRLEKYGSSVANICHASVFVVGAFPHGIMNDPRTAVMSQARKQAWQERYGAEFAVKTVIPTTIVGVTALARPEMLVEIQIVAFRD